MIYSLSVWTDCTPHTEKRIRRRFIPSLQHDAQMCHVLCCRWLQRIGLLVAVARRHPTAIMVQCMRVNSTFKRRRAASFFDVCSQNRRRLFSLHRRDVCAVSVLVSKYFVRYRYRIDTGGIGRYRVPEAGIGLTLSTTQLKLQIWATSAMHRVLTRQWT